MANTEFTSDNPLTVKRWGGKKVPAKSQAQQKMMAIALHEPSKLYARNRGALGMSKESLEEFASTKRKGLPKNKKKDYGKYSLGR